MHFIDEGQGLPVILLHGNPTWSFSYRNVVLATRDRCRLIAPDYLGFGLSDKPLARRPTPDTHAQSIRRLADALGLERFVLVLQDWGGPIGLAAAQADPDRVAGLVVCNTFCGRSAATDILYGLLGTKAVGPLHTWLNILPAIGSPKSRLPSGDVDRDVAAAYAMPFEGRAGRLAAYDLIRSLKTSSGWLENVQHNMHRLSHLPCEIVVGAEDRVLGTTKVVASWREQFADSHAERVPGAGHFVQEDAPERVAAAILRLVGRVAQSCRPAR